MRKTKYIIISKLNLEARLLIRSYSHEIICGLKVDGPVGPNKLSQSNCAELVRIPHIKRPRLPSDSVACCERNVTIALCPCWLRITFEARDGGETIRMSNLHPRLRILMEVFAGSRVQNTAYI